MIVFWFSADKLSYSQGPEADRVTYFPNSILVTQCPGEGYAYDFDAEQWFKDLATEERAWQGLRNEMLEKTNWLRGDDSPFDANEKVTLDAWRASLVTMFDQAPVLIDKPEYPVFVQPWV